MSQRWKDDLYIQHNSSKKNSSPIVLELGKLILQCIRKNKGP